jgi:hypothetical protein
LARLEELDLGDLPPFAWKAVYLGVGANLPATITRRIVVVRGVSVGFTLSSAVSKPDN